MKGIGAGLLLLLLIACGKDRIITAPDARLQLSTDSLRFDTVFTSAGSTYRFLKIINDNDRKLRLDEIELRGGTASVFKLNVDGQPGTRFTSLELAANDSLYVFVQVNIQPGSGSLPFVVRDSLRIRWNGNTRHVQLEAWGQNAIYLRNKVVSTDETWTAALPYVILGSLQVNTGITLTLQKGTRVYVNGAAPVLVNGTLVANGQKDTADRVYFAGDRLDEPYRDYPGSWPGIFFGPASQNNQLTYTVLRHAYQALALRDPAPNGQPKLILNECVIDNAFDAGVLALNSSLRARNCQISNCGKNLVLAAGGDYQFTHCTVVSYSNRYILHKEPVLTVSNYSGSAVNPLNALFRNCLFWGEGGTVNDEVVVQRSGTGAFSVNFDYALWKVQQNPANSIANQVINNQPPLFDSIHTASGYYDFRLKSGSPALNKGVATGIPTDLDGRPRAAGLPDLGCFERQ